jgi:hypothetical protein
LVAAADAVDAAGFTTRLTPPSCCMWLFRNNPLKKIADPFAALSL